MFVHTHPHMHTYTHMYNTLTCIYKQEYVCICVVLGEWQSDLTVTESGSKSVFIQHRVQVDAIAMGLVPTTIPH